MGRKTKAMLVLVSFLMAFLVGTGTEGARDVPRTEEVYSPQLFWGWPWLGGWGGLTGLTGLAGLAGLLGPGLPFRPMGGFSGSGGWPLHKAPRDFYNGKSHDYPPINGGPGSGREAP